MLSSKGQPSSIYDRLPVFGPLKIKNVDEFLSSSKKRFDELYYLPCPYITDVRDFDVLVVLGKGHFGSVYLVRDKKKQFCAMKALRKRHLVKKKQLDHAFNEKRILQCIDFPFGVRMEYFAKDNSFIYFFMPFITGGEMFYHLRSAEKFEENLARFYAAQVVLGLEYLHNLNLVYRDLKPENILLDHLGYLKITDFGFTKLVPLRTFTLCGTPPYFAPEAIKGQGYGKSVDWWALGVLVYEMSAGFAPFHSKSNTRMMMKILLGKYEMPKFFSAELKDLISKLLTADVSARIGILKDGVMDLKLHPWFKSINWLPLFNRSVEAPFVPETTNLAYNFPVGNLKASELKASEENEYEEFFKDF